MPSREPFRTDTIDARCEQHADDLANGRLGGCGPSYSPGEMFLSDMVHYAINNAVDPNDAYNRAMDALQESGINVKNIAWGLGKCGPPGTPGPVGDDGGGSGPIGPTGIPSPSDPPGPPGADPSPGCFSRTE